MPDGELVTHEMPDWKTPWNHDRDFESRRTATYTPEESLTKQEFKDDADINNILDRFMRTGQPPDIVLPEHFADTTTSTSYFEMASRVADANETFYLLPAAKRAEFLNDPTRWADEVVRQLHLGNTKKLADLGITATEKPPETTQDDPLSGSTPDPKAVRKAPEASKTGDTPDPKSDTPKK